MGDDDLIVAVPVTCPYCGAKVGQTREGWLVGVQHGLGGQHTMLTANPAAMRFEAKPIDVEIP